MPNTKLIYTGLDCPVVNPRGVKTAGPSDIGRHWERLKALPFDGISLYIMDPDPTVPYPRNLIGNNLIGGKRYRYEDFQGVIRQLNPLTRVRNLSTNFLPIATGYWFATGKENRFDWFDEERIKTTEANLRLYSRLAGESGVIHGFTLDVEPYRKPPVAGEPDEWAYNPFSLNVNYNLVNPRTGSTDARGDYFRRLRECGSRFYRALASHMPGVPILLYLGYGVATEEEKKNPNRGDLFPHFLDGVLEEIERSRGKGLLVDGYEGAYLFRDAGQYRSIRNSVLHDFKRLSSVPQLYTKYMRVGFGKWLDAAPTDAAGVWHSEDPGKNYYTPEQWQRSLELALEYADNYVWVWSGGQGRFFPMSDNRPANVPPAYYRATLRAKQ